MLFVVQCVVCVLQEYCVIVVAVLHTEQREGVFVRCGARSDAIY